MFFYRFFQAESQNQFSPAVTEFDIELLNKLFTFAFFELSFQDEINFAVSPVLQAESLFHFSPAATLRDYEIKKPISP